MSWEGAGHPQLPPSRETPQERQRQDPQSPNPAPGAGNEAGTPIKSKIKCLVHTSLTENILPSLVSSWSQSTATTGFQHPTQPKINVLVSVLPEPLFSHKNTPAKFLQCFQIIPEWKMVLLLTHSQLAGKGKRKITKFARKYQL